LAYRFLVTTRAALTLVAAIVAVLSVASCKREGGRAGGLDAVPSAVAAPTLQDASTALESALAPAKADLAVEAAELLKDYKANEIRGDEKYKGKRVRIVGQAGEIKRDLTGSMYVTVGTGTRFELPRAQCFFGNDHAEQLAGVEPGQPVLVDGTVEGLMGNVLLRACSFPSTVAYNVCVELKNAGIAKQCVGGDLAPAWTTDDAVPFSTADPGAGRDLDGPHAKAFVQRTTGFVIFASSAKSYEHFVSTFDVKDDAGVGADNIVGSPSARIIVVLPNRPAFGLRQRVKTVVDRLSGASQ
jgi:hypothetical protein